MEIDETAGGQVEGAARGNDADRSSQNIPNMPTFAGAPNVPQMIPRHKHCLNKRRPHKCRTTAWTSIPQWCTRSTSS